MVNTQDPENWNWEDWIIEPAKWLLDVIGITDPNPLSIVFLVLAFLGLCYLVARIALPGLVNFKGIVPREYRGGRVENFEPVQRTVRPFRSKGPVKSGFEVPSKIYNFTPNIKMASDLFIPKRKKREV